MPFRVMGCPLPVVHCAECLPSFFFYNFGLRRHCVLFVASLCGLAGAASIAPFPAPAPAGPTRYSNPFMEFEAEDPAPIFEPTAPPLSVLASLPIRPLQVLPPPTQDGTGPISYPALPPQPGVFVGQAVPVAQAPRVDDFCGDDPE